MQNKKTVIMMGIKISSTMQEILRNLGLIIKAPKIRKSILVSWNFHSLLADPLLFSEKKVSYFLLIYVF
jgi:hypothetical protein